MTGSTYLFRLLLPSLVRVEGRSLDREEFFAWVWRTFSSYGLLGVHEGTVLSEQASGEGLNTESWTVDSGEAPRDRDWISNQSIESVEFYFDSEKSALSASSQIAAMTGLAPEAIRVQKPQDWDAEWKASFMGLSVPPFWEVRPPWYKETIAPGKKLLCVNPGAGFGTGTHETTQLCLRALGALSTRKSLKEEPVLDFGSGSGILSIGAALLGAKVDAVEIDPLANENAQENAKLNGVEASISFQESLPVGVKSYSVVIANILRPVLLEFAEKLTGALESGGVLILSGLIESDVAPIIQKFGPLIPSMPSRPEPRVESLNEWRAVVWEP